jgi:FKBP-type peptidyl-prolyl cis-trans isomerase
MKRALVTIGRVALVAILCGLTSLAACRRSTALVTEDLRVGRGAEAQAGSRVAVHYVARLKDGVQVDDSHARGRPTEFVVGHGMVVPGFEQGVVGMRAGGLRRITVPPSLAYGQRAGGPTIPSGSTLIFEVELIAVM